MNTILKITLFLAVTLAATAQNKSAVPNCLVPAADAVWQWSSDVPSVVSSETNAHPQTFLWIPEDCKQVRAVVVGQHNMTEETIFEHPEFRKAMTELGFAIVWITPGLDGVFDFNKGAGEAFEEMMNRLADVSGYSELKFAPIVPIGHSACASYPWNFGAWNPGRTLAMLSIHGDAPLTNLTGSGRPNPVWGDRNTNGVPGLMVEGEYEWWEDRVAPCFTYQQKFPDAPVSFLTDAGRGHFDISDCLVRYLALFLKKAAQYRLPAVMPLDRPATLLPVYPKQGWLADRWHKDESPHAAAASYANYSGDRKNCFWYFDQEMAEATEACYARVRGKKEQYIGLTQHGSLLPFNQKLHARIQAPFNPEADGLTFHLAPEFTDTLRSRLSNEHATGKPMISRLCGPVEVINDTTFTVRFYRMGLNNVRRTNDIWLMASHPGDSEYKSTVQQWNVCIPYRNTAGTPQKIDFPTTPNVPADAAPVKLQATATSGLPVQFYVKEGPALIRDGQLIFTPIPPRAAFPVKVTVVAWQYGRAAAPAIQTAEPVERTFFMEKSSKEASKVLQIYPVAKELLYSRHNDDFTVQVRTPGGDWQDLFEYKVLVDLDNPQTASMVQFDFSGKVEMRVKLNNGRVNDVQIRPFSKGIKSRIEGNVISFTLDKPAKLSLEVNGDRLHNLHVFANPMETDIPNPADAHVVWFAPGVYKPADGKAFRFHSNQTVYLAPGAILRGKVLCDSAENVRFLGRGFIDEPERGFEVTFCKNIEINGLTVLNPTHYTVYGGQTVGLKISNLKSFSCRGWSDGIDLMSCRDVTIDDVFLRTSDDCIAVYGHRWSYFGDARNYVVTNAILWPDVAHPITMGLHGTPETTPETIENLTFSNIDILEHDEDDPNYQGCLSISAGDMNLVQDVTFENIRVESIQEGQLFNLRTVFNEKYNAGPGRGIRNITFRNIRYTGCDPNPSILQGLDSNHPVENIVFENIVVNGKRIKSPESAYIRIGPNVQGVTFK